MKKFTNDEEPEYNPDKWSALYIEGSHNVTPIF